MEPKISDRRGNYNSFTGVRSEIEKVRGRLSVAAFCRSATLEYIQRHPLGAAPTSPPESQLHLVSELAPDAVIYTVPISGAKIVTSPRKGGGWKGLMYDPMLAGSMSAWNTENLVAPIWARTNSIYKALCFIASRVDDDGVVSFKIKDSRFMVIAVWDSKEKRFQSGYVIDPKIAKQGWKRAPGSELSVMDPGPFNTLPNVRRMLTMLCGARVASEVKL